MIDRKLVNRIDKLNQLELLELDKLIHKRINELAGKRITYILKAVRCGNYRNCKKCQSGERHKYWYAYVRVKDKQYWYYLGKEKREVTLDEILQKNKKSGDSKPKVRQWAEVRGIIPSIAKIHKETSRRGVKDSAQVLSC